ncbi:MAG: hypothetical protein FWH27_03275 [Planctomycetaceae bacterium]|nr:hypothetical protein [Planctomycetaceae bacterium]
MAEMTDPHTNQSTVTEEPVEVFDTSRLKNPLLAAVLAWLVPGLGHWYQGRREKAVLFFICIMSIFLFGCYLGSDREYGPARVVYAKWTKGEKRLFFIPQAFLGIAAIPATLQENLVKQGLPPRWDGLMAPPNSPATTKPKGNPTINNLYEHLGRYFELGTIFTVIAGFMNILVVFDAVSGPVIETENTEQDKKKKKDTEDQKKSETP